MKIYNKKNIIVWLIVALFFVSVYAVSAASDIPANLQLIRDANLKQTSEFALKISFVIAFIAGILGVLSPCILPFLPAYFSYTFKEKKNITVMTLVFFIGFSAVFVAMGIIAGLLGEQAISALQNGWVPLLAGGLVVVLGIATLLGLSFSSLFKGNRRFTNDVPGVLLFGGSFALGWTACLGPILAGILAMGALLHDVGSAALLLFFYSLGNIVPLIILSVLYDRFDLGKRSWVRGKMVKYSLGEHQFVVHSTAIISGVLLIAFGAFVILSSGTGLVNGWDFLGTKEYFYSSQRALLEWPYATIAGSIALVLFVVGLVLFLVKKYRRPKIDKSSKEESVVKSEKKNSKSKGKTRK